VPESTHAYHTFPEFEAAVTRRREAYARDADRTSQWILQSSESVPQNLVLPRTCLPVSRETSKGVATINEGVAAEMRGKLDEALEKYSSGLAIVTRALSTEKNVMKAHQIRSGLGPFFIRANKMALTPRYQWPCYAKDASQLAMFDLEPKVQAVANAIGMYPVASGQPYARTTAAVLEEAASRDKALKLEHDNYVEFLQQCFEAPPQPLSGDRVKFSKPKWGRLNQPLQNCFGTDDRPMGNVEPFHGFYIRDYTAGGDANPTCVFPLPNIRTVSEVQNTVAKSRQEVEQMWLSALAKSN